MRAALVRANLAQELDPSLWTRSWNVHVQQIGTGEHVALYLSRNIYRVALTNQRLVRFDHGQVSFRYTHARTRQARLMTLPVHHFLTRFLQHVLPRGFPKIRSYGLLSPGRRDDLERARHVLQLHAPSCFGSSSSTSSSQSATACIDSLPNADTTRPPSCCPHCCRGQLLLIERFARARAPP